MILTLNLSLISHIPTKTSLSPQESAFVSLSWGVGNLVTGPPAKTWGQAGAVKYSGLLHSAPPDCAA